MSKLAMALVLLTAPLSAATQRPPTPIRDKLKSTGAALGKGALRGGKALGNVVGGVLGAVAGIVSIPITLAYHVAKK